MDSEKPVQNHQKQQMQEYDALSKIAHLLFVGPLRTSSCFQLAKRGVMKHGHLDPWPMLFKNTDPSTIYP